MKSIVIIGSQWGDEGKGKIVDLIAQNADAVVRFQGGANAGHTIYKDGQKIVLHLVPSGILHPQTTCFLTAGVALDLTEIQEEIKTLKSLGFINSPKQIRICDNAHIVLPFHRTLDKAREEKLSDNKVGTTGRGIGPSYEDRASRRGILFSDLFKPNNLKEKINILLEEKNILLTQLYKEKPIEAQPLIEMLLAAGDALAPYRETNASQVINAMLEQGKRVVFEGAQGALLDNAYGSYPFVTSSFTTAGFTCAGSGVGPSKIDRVYGITKAYCTRVGSGPFPTELFDAQGEKLQTIGKEFGATTGRRRRCGWLDLVALRYAKNISGINALILTKLDILSEFDDLNICNGYEIDGKIYKDFPINHPDLNKAKPVLTKFKGWSTSLDGVKNRAGLPDKAKDYIKFIEDETKCPVEMLSIGPEREHVLTEGFGFLG